MAGEKYISSLQNPLIKRLLQLKEKKRGRNKLGLFVLEGQRELSMALKASYQLEALFYCPEVAPEEIPDSLSINQQNPPEQIAVSKGVYQRIAYREKTEGVLAIARAKSHQLADLKLKRKHPLIMVAQSPEKPGNLGALLRTADAANLDAVLLADPKSDLYNPNVIRSSVGCIFTVNIGVGSTMEILEYLKKNNIAIYSATLSAKTLYSEVDLTPSTAIAVGTEATGLTKEWVEASKDQIIIPMKGEIDSMNVSVSAAILIFEALRQRSFQ